MAETEKKQVERQVEVYPTLIEKSIRNEAMLLVLLNAVGELTAHIQQTDPHAVKVSLHERVEKARIKVLKAAYGIPDDDEQTEQEIN